MSDETIDKWWLAASLAHHKKTLERKKINLLLVCGVTAVSIIGLLVMNAK